MIANKHYKLVPSTHDEKHTSIELLTGEYAGIKYYYSSVSVTENEDSATLHYSFKIENGNELYECTSELDRDDDFKIIMNKILHNILTEKYAQH
jgi:hypothetical protein